MRVPSTTLSVRIRQAAAFVAIVWGLAVSFIAFDLAALSGLDLILATSVGRSYALSDTVRDSQTCVVPPGTERPSGAAPEHVDATAWLLGVMSGTHAMVSRWAGPASGGPDAGTPEWRRQAEERAGLAARAVAELAADLRVPEPARFTGQERADANTAYRDAVEADAAGTGRGLALRYSATACHLYKLGAYWGYAAEVRNALPGERSIFALEIEHHARDAGLPAELWTPVLAATPRDATTAQLVAQTQQLSVAITQHLTRAR